MNRKVRTIGAAAVRAAVFAALIGLAAGCSSSPPGSGNPSATGPATSAAAATAPVSSAPASTASASASAPAGTATASASASAAGFVGIVEPFDPGHPARTAGPGRLLQPALDRVHRRVLRDQDGEH